jgi:hypothetical protein
MGRGAESDHDHATSSPSSETPLKARTNPVQSKPSPTHAQDSLTQPLQAEDEQERAYHEAERRQRHRLQRGTQRFDQDGQDQKTGKRPRQCPAPLADTASLSRRNYATQRSRGSLGGLEVIVVHVV